MTNEWGKKPPHYWVAIQVLGDVKAVCNADLGFFLTEELPITLPVPLRIMYGKLEAKVEKYRLTGSKGMLHALCYAPRIKIERGQDSLIVIACQCFNHLYKTMQYRTS